MIWDALAEYYLWIKALHIMAVIAWMAGLFYLPRLFVHHAERAAVGSEMSETFKMMEHKLLKVIINPAGIAVWIFGLMMVFSPASGLDWGSGWTWIKAGCVIAMTIFHHALVRWTKVFAEDRNARPGRYYRAMNEVPTVLMIGIVVFVVVRPF